jgi:hypothetical protein
LKPNSLQVVSLPSCAARVIPLLGAAMALDGPSTDGEVVYLERRFGDNPCYLVRKVSLFSGDDTLLLKRSGSLNPASAIAISPDGAHVAFTSSIDHGGYDYSPWVLEVMDVATTKCTRVDGRITQHHPLWFPDSPQLAFVEWRSSDRTLTTSILDVESGERRILRQGTTLAMARGISPDGRAVLFGDNDPLLRVDATTGEVLGEPFHLGGLSSRLGDPTNSWNVVADLGDGKFLSQGPPTTGTVQELVSGYLSGAKWTMKLFDVRTGAFVTVIPYVWGDVSYGIVDPPALDRLH